MENGNKIKTLRNLMLDLYEVGETLTPYVYALNLMEALKQDQIDSDQFQLLSGSFELYCKKEKISTNINFQTLAGL